MERAGKRGGKRRRDSRRGEHRQKTEADAQQFRLPQRDRQDRVPAGQLKGTIQPVGAEQRQLDPHIDRHADEIHPAADQKRRGQLGFGEPSPAMAGT